MRAKIMARLGWMALVLTLAASLLVGCVSGGDVRLQSVANPERVVRPALPTAVFVPTGAAGVDIYLTDLSRRDLDPLADLSLVDGHIVHIHMFLRPSPGRTPIDSNATNATVRHMIFTRGVVGSYEGAGFLLPRMTPGSDTFAARLREASVRLMRHDPGFSDPLGAATLSAEIRAREDPALARLIARRLERESLRLPSVRELEDAAREERTP